MKNKLILLLFISTFGLMSCNDSDIDVGESNEPAISGTWYMTNARGGIAGFNEDYARGEIIWVFDDESGVLTVTKNIKDVTGFTSGTYSYSVSKDGDTLHIDESFSALLTINDENMVINHGAADGFVYTFER